VPAEPLRASRYVTMGAPPSPPSKSSLPPRRAAERRGRRRLRPQAPVHLASPSSSAAASTFCLRSGWPPRLASPLLPSLRPPGKCENRRRAPKWMAGGNRSGVGEEEGGREGERRTLAVPASLRFASWREATYFCVLVHLLRKMGVLYASSVGARFFTVKDAF
jgi:hypothetical protein